jgi:membrane-bound lytic murein transglycosylase D
MASFVAVTALIFFAPWFLLGCGNPLPPYFPSTLPWTRPAQSPNAQKTQIIKTTWPEPTQEEPTHEPKLLAQELPGEMKEQKAEEKIAEERQEKKEAPEKTKKTKTREEPPTALQEAPGPKADDRLLGLWQLELEKAMQQPPGRRKIQFSMPLVENNRVRYFIDLFCGRMREFFERALARSGRYIPMMAAILQEAGLPEDLVYLSLIESGFSPQAYSRARAVGPWQFIRSTGLRYGLRIDGWVDERRDPVKSTRAAAAYLKDLHQQFGEWFLAAAAYNAGESKVEKAIHRSQTNDFWLLSQKTNLKQETRNYVPKFIAAALIAATPEKYGFGDIVYQAPVEYDEVTVKRPLTLQSIARLAQVPVGESKELNPALLGTTTPPSQNGFLLRLPAGSGQAFAQAYSSRFDSSQPRALTHTVKKGETLSAIAKRYHQRVSQIIEVNDLKTQQIRVGQQLIIVLEGGAKK